MAAEGPGGAVLIYQVPNAVFKVDRPFILQLGPTQQAASVQLDV